MNIFNFFSTVADNFRQHYLELFQNTKNNHTPKHYYNLNNVPQEPSPPKTDSYEPSPKAKELANETKAKKGEDKHHVPKKKVHTEKPEYNHNYNDIYYKRKAKLDYKLKLQFNLAAITSTVEQIANGETQSLEEFAAAGFGLKAAMDFKGKDVIETNYNDASHPEEVKGHMKGKSLLQSRQAGEFAYQSKDFAIQSFQESATKVQRSLDIKVHGNHQRAVNKFALRFRLDHSFSFAFLNRFNIQTEQISKADPQNLNGYVNTAGNVAEKSTPEMMAVFFDAVDEYLNQAESELIARANEFFDMAAKELGFSGEMVEIAREHMTGTIESFFNNVDRAIENIQSKFVNPEIAKPIPVIENLPPMALDYTDQPDIKDKTPLAIA